MRYKIVNLFDRVVEKEIASEQEATHYVTQVVGLVVVDREKSRVYDGEYQQWSSLQDYCRKFPAVAWIATL